MCVQKLLRMTLFIASVVLFITPAYPYENELGAIAASIADAAAGSGKKIIAVTDFTDLAGNITEIGRFFAEEFLVALVRTGKVEVIERSRLRKMLADSNISPSGTINPALAGQIGKVSGADIIVAGTVTALADNTLRLTVKVISSDSSNVVAAVGATIQRPRALDDLIKGDTSTTQSPSADQPIQQDTSVQVAEANGFVFLLKSCVRQGPTVTCKFTIINRESGNNYINLHRIRAYDTAGRLYLPKSATIGSTVLTFDRNGAVRVPAGVTTGAFDQYLPVNSSVDVLVSFENISKSMTKIGVLSTAWAGVTRNTNVSSTLHIEGDEFGISFRDFAISGAQ